MTTKKTEETKEVTVKSENNDCFIIMPIADHPDYKQGHFKRVYEDIFAPACRAAGYRPVRADDVAQTNLIHLDILQKLLESPMAICDLSTRNPNVLFELGLRQAFDKPTILVQEVGTPQIFDINLFRYTQYRNGLDYRDVLADQKSIQKVIEETKQSVEEGKSVNSIIKLLSITNPATLQDSSKFGEKEYFNVLMSEFDSLKKQIIYNQDNRTYDVERINEEIIRNYNLYMEFNRIISGDEFEIIMNRINKSPRIKKVKNVEVSANEIGSDVLSFEFESTDKLTPSTAYLIELINSLKIKELQLNKIAVRKIL